MDPVTFQLAGHPQGKGRARSFIHPHSGRLVTTTPPKTRSYESMIRGAAMDAMGDRPPLECPVRVTLTAFFDIPKSFSRLKRSAAITGEIKPAKKPDIDNIIKAWVDAMNGVVFKDDCQIVRGEYAKVYGPAPMVVVTVAPA